MHEGFCVECVMHSNHTPCRAMSVWHRCNLDLSISDLHEGCNSLKVSDSDPTECEFSSLYWLLFDAWSEAVDVLLVFDPTWWDLFQRCEPLELLVSIRLDVLVFVSWPIFHYFELCSSSSSSSSTGRAFNTRVVIPIFHPFRSSYSHCLFCCKSKTFKNTGSQSNTAIFPMPLRSGVIPPPLQGRWSGSRLS